MNTMTETKSELTRPDGRPAQLDFAQAIQVRPPVDLIEQEDGFVMFVEMPGVEPSQVDVAIEQNVLFIKGTAEFPTPEGFRLVSGDVGRRLYARSFQLSEDIDRERIDAEVKHGVLTLRLPKTQRALRSKIAVRVG